jgi:amidase
MKHEEALDAFFDRRQAEVDRRSFLRLSGATALYTGLLSACGDPEADSSTVVAPAFDTDEIARLDALGQAELFKSGEVSAVELVESAIRRIEAFDGPLNAVVHKAHDYARQLAELATPEDGPFAGVPYLLKCLEAKAGMPNTNASRYFAEHVADESDAVTKAMEQAGLIYLGQSNAPEFGTIGSTEPTLYGATNNPWDATRSPAGSSGGSAAAVAAGLVPIATADDGGGSIRMPASACGLVGLKCSRGREVGHERSLFVNTGCVSRSVRDTAAVVDAIERKDNPDLPAVGRIERPSDVRLKVAFTTQGNDTSVQPDPEVAAGAEATARLLESLGHEVEEARFDVDGQEFWGHFWALWSAGLAGTVGRAREQLGREPDDREFEAWTRGVAAYGVANATDQAQADAMSYLGELRARHRAFLQRYDVQLTPVVSSPPLPTGLQDPRREDFEALMQLVQSYINYTVLHNASGLPSLSLPLHWTSDGLPVGSLFSADYGREATLLHLAYELEQAQPWAERWAPLSVFGA